MTTSTILHNVSADQINSLFQGLQKQLIEIKENFEAKTPATDPKYITRKEAAKILRVGLTKLNELTKSGELPTYRIGCNIRLIEHEVRASLKKVDTGKGGSNV